MDFKQDIRDYIDCEINTLQKLDVAAINQALNLLLEAYRAHKWIYIFGNGGSSSTASHFENDFNKGVSEPLKTKFRFRCLNDNVATLMAVANDMGFEEVFRYQLTDRIEAGDLVIAISGSGNSKNVINAVEYAKSCGNKIIGITGYDGGKLRQMCDVSLHVPVNSMQISEDVHMIFDHLMMSMFYKHLCGINHLHENS
jgi:D-sedoheptulose 7-phosphate isomerase